MRRAAAVFAALASLLAAAPAWAVSTSFHTYDGFKETVGAFRLVSLIFSDPRYETLVVIVAVVGIGLGALLASVRGSGAGLMAFGFQILVGVGLFVGLISTTGTVHVYDRVRNAYQPVGGVPVLLVIVAGVTNLMERALVEIIDNGAVNQFARIENGAGGHSFDLFLNAVSPRGPMTDMFLDANAGFNSTETGSTSSSATAAMDIVNYDVRNARHAALYREGPTYRCICSDRAVRAALGPASVSRRGLGATASRTRLAAGHSPS